MTISLLLVFILCFAKLNQHPLEQRQYRLGASFSPLDESLHLYCPWKDTEREDPVGIEGFQGTMLLQSVETTDQETEGHIN